MKRALFFIFFGSIFYGSGQDLTILDKDTRFPIRNVEVHSENKTKKAISNKNGMVNIDDFSDNEVLTFNHLSFVEFEILKRQIPADNIIYLQSVEHQLEEIFLSTSKGQESRQRIAEQIDILSIKDIQRLQPQTSADLLAAMPGIKVQKSQAGGGSPVIRGMEANRILLVVDGVRMNNAIYRKGHLQNSITVSPNMLDRTEVIFGPSSVVYGSDALGGVIHYYTRKPNTSDKFNSEVSMMSRFSSANTEFTAQAGVELMFKKFGSYTSFSRSEFGDLQMGKKRGHGFDNWGLVPSYSNNTDHYYNPNEAINSDPNRQRNTAYNQTDVLQKFFIPLSEKSDLNINFQYSTTSNLDRFDRLTERRDGDLRFAEWYYGPQDRVLVSTQLNLEPQLKWLEQGSITMAYQNIKESRTNRKFNSLDRTIRKEKVDVFSLNTDFSVPLTADKDRILSYGFELTHNEVESTPEGKTLAVSGDVITGFSGTFPVQARYADGGSSYTTLAAYTNYRQDISPRATLNSGIRITNTQLNALWEDQTFISLPKNDISLNNTAVTATLGYVYKPSKIWQFNGVLSSGFRSPNIDDVGKVRERSGDVTVPNIYLKPEYAYNLEFGFLKYFNKKKSYFGFTTYYTLLDNYITRTDFTLNGSSTILFDGEEGNIVANVNKDQAGIMGFTATLQGTIATHFTAHASLTYTQGKAYDTKEPLSSIPPWFGRIGANFEKGKFTCGIDFIFNTRKKPNTYNLSEGIDRFEDTPFDQSTQDYYGTPAWATVDINAKYRLVKNIDILASLDNVLDQHYKEFASGISAPGRGFSVS